jgi:hypothetical protein
VLKGPVLANTYGAVVKGHTYYRCTYGQNYGKVAADAVAGHGTTCNVREDTLLPVIQHFFADRLFGPMRLDLLREQLDLQSRQAPPTSSGRPLDCKRR